MGSIAALIYERALDHLDNHLVRVNAADVPAPYRAGQPSSCREDRRDSECGDVQVLKTGMKGRTKG